MLLEIKNDITKTLQIADVHGDVVLTSPPNPNMGDMAFACFGLAKEWEKSPSAVAKEIVSKLGNEEVKKLWGGFIERIQAVGPYVNFFINAQALAKELLAGREESYERLTIGQGKKILVEFGCPNPLKVFHLGHLKNLITGESVARILENAGYEVVRVNYQGDVGMHVAKVMWSLMQNEKFKMQNVESDPLDKRIEFLGRAYVAGAKAFEDDESARRGIEALNKRVYEQDIAIQALYQTTRQWSLDYFGMIYQKLGVRFDRLYFESETAWRGVEIVRRHCQRGVFKESDGAIIYEGSRRGLHDRVFINSEGFATYEAKELALAERHFADYKPDRIIHVVGKEQAEYFKVVFKAIEEIWPEHAGREFHLPGGYLQLRGQQKMSSRTGQVIAGDELLLAVEKRVREIMYAQGGSASGGKDGDKAGNDEIVRKVTDAVLTYAMLKVQVSQDVAFDLEASVSTNGDSGPYLQYIIARIKSILRKQSGSGGEDLSLVIDQLSVNQFEKQLLLRLAEFPAVAQTAAEELDPSQIAQYLFVLAQAFNTFYHECPVLQADEGTRVFRLRLIQVVEQVMTRGLALLGIEAVEEM